MVAGKKPKEPEDEFFGAGKRRPLPKKKYEELRRRSRQRIARTLKPTWNEYRNFVLRVARLNAQLQRAEMRFASEVWSYGKEMEIVQTMSRALEKQWNFTRDYAEKFLEFHHLIKLPEKVMVWLVEIPQKMRRLEIDLQRLRSLHRETKALWQESMKLLHNECRKNRRYLRLRKNAAESRKGLEKAYREFESGLVKIMLDKKTGEKEKNSLAKKITSEYDGLSAKNANSEVLLLDFLIEKAKQLELHESFLEELVRRRLLMLERIRTKK